MNHFLGIIVLVAMTSGLWGQSSENPFDLKFREASRPVSTPALNPVEAQEDTIKFITPSDSLNVPAHNEIGEQTRNTTDSFILDVTKDSSAIEQNPFETSLKDDTLSGAPGGGEIKEKDQETRDSLQKNAKGRFAPRGFQIFFLLLSILFLIFIVNVERSFISDLWRVISNENYSSLHHRNQRNTMRQILLLMGYLIFIFQAGLFINLSLQIYHYTESVLSNLWLSIAVVLGVYLVRHTVIRYLKWLFNNEKELSLFAFDISIFNTMVGLILLPINILLIFGPDGMYNVLIIIGLSAAGLAYLLRQLRWMMASGRLIFNSLFLFFIYLCAVEILPLWTISKIFW